MSANPNARDSRRLADHSADLRLVLLSAGSAAIGVAAAFGAWTLIRLIALATNLFWNGRLSAQAMEIGTTHSGTLIVIMPIAGSLIIGLMARFGSEKIRGHGIPEAIEAILYGESRLSLKVAILKPISSAISIGSGGPFGAEGPIIMTGGAIGSLIAQRFRLSAAERKTLLVAGAAAGMTGIFGTPLAAILLAIEVLLFEWKPRSLVPVVIAVLASLGLRPFLIGQGPLFPFIGTIAVDFTVIALALGVGIVTGLQSALLTSLLYRIEDLFHRLPVHWMWWPALGGVGVGMGGLVDGRVLGAGYGNIQALLDGSISVRSVWSLLVVKGAVWLLALGSGTSGGVLAPLLIVGGASGALMGQVLPGAVGFWALIGMAGILSGSMRAPLTAAVFAIELTGASGALPATIAAAAGAYAVSVLVLRRSILTEKIARRGRHILQEYTVDPLEFLQAAELMTTDPVTLPGTMTIAEAITYFCDSATHRSYPVVDKEGLLEGLVSRSDALRWQVDGDLDDITISEALSDASQPFARRSAPIGDVADLMVDTGIGRIPILDDLDSRVIGILTRHDLLKARSAQRHAEVQRA